MFKKILIILLLVGLVNANDVDSGVLALKKQDYQTASEFFQKACDEGDAYGCDFLGAMYDEGKGTKLDNFKAVSLFQKGCDLGGSSSCNSLGIAYGKGKGVRQSDELALKYCGMACDMKDELGCRNYTKLKSKCPFEVRRTQMKI